MFSFNDVAFWFMVLGGLGLFLYGICSISTVLKKIAGKKLRETINKCSSNRFLGLLVGTGFTAVIQSSSGTSALTIGLVRAGVMTLAQACAIIIGANVGTTITSFIVSIPLSEYMPIFVLIGSFMLLLFTRKKWLNIGELVFGLGCIFFGLWIMEMNLKTLANVPEFINIFVFLVDYPWLGLLIGAILTTCLQSSSAVIGVMQGLYAASILAFKNDPSILPITLFGILPIVFGANIGTTTTAFLSSIGGSKEAKRVAMFHVMFNVFGSLLFMGAIYIFKDFLSQSYSWSIEPKVQLALVHLIFNVITCLIFFPLITPLMKLTCLIIPGKDKTSPFIAIKELDNKVMKEFPSEGISLAKEQILTMFECTKIMFDSILLYLKLFNKEDADLVHQLEGNVDRFDRQLNDYLLTADKGELSSSDMVHFSRILRACKDIERIGDYGENLITFFENMSERKEKVNENTLSTLLKCTELSLTIIKKTIDAFKNEDLPLSLEIIKERRHYNEQLEEDISKHFDSISLGKKGTKYIDLVFVDILNSYQRVNSHCSNIAKLFGTDKEYIYSTSEEEHFASLKDRY